MICLECGVDNTYGADACKGCQIELTTIPPHTHSNHVCQMTLAIQEYLEGQLPRKQFLISCVTFARIAQTFEDAWGSGEASLSSRLAEPLQARYLGPLSEMDRGLKELQTVIDLLHQFQEGGEDSLLAHVEEKLLDYFRLVCAGSAGIIHELELEELRQIKLGTMHDYSA